MTVEEKGDRHHVRFSFLLPSHVRSDQAKIRAKNGF